MDGPHALRHLDRLLENLATEGAYVVEGQSEEEARAVEKLVGV